MFEKVHGIESTCFDQINTLVHRSRLVKDKSKKLKGVEVLLHPAYIPQVSASDYGVFRSMPYFDKVLL